jgi:hypothetical protein
MKPRKREYVLMVAFVLLAAHAEWRFAETESKIVAESKAQSDTRYAELLFPLKFDATATHSGTPGQPARTYFYARSDQ